MHHKAIIFPLHSKHGDGGQTSDLTQISNVWYLMIWRHSYYTSTDRYSRCFESNNEKLQRGGSSITFQHIYTQ